MTLCCGHWAIIHRKGSTVGRGLKSGKHDLHGRSEDTGGVQSTEGVIGGRYPNSLQVEKNYVRIIIRVNF